MKIHKLTKILINQISAGEIIENPACIVKEIIENSIDAKSDNIYIKIINGGKERIIIKDNGIGISQNELILSIQNHTTSKINNLNDLNDLNTLGFRGEALASICSISSMIITSKTINQDLGWQLYVEYNKIIYFKPVPHNVGTTIEIFNIFNNFPVRLNNLKSKIIEYNLIYNLIYKFILIYVDITFTFYHNNKKILFFEKQKTKKIFERFKLLHKNICIKNFIFINKKNNFFKIYGWISNIKYKLPIKLIQFIFINKRIIKYNKIHNIILNVYNKNKSIIKYNPSYILFIFIKPNEINVNIHPKKNKIKFLNEEHILNLLNEIFYLKLINLTIINEPIKNNIKKYNKKIIIDNKFNIIFTYNKYALIEYNKEIYFLFFYEMEIFLIKYNFLINIKKILIIIPIRIEKKNIKNHLKKIEYIKHLGIDFSFLNNNTIIIKTLPISLLHINIKDFLNDLLNYLINNKNNINTIYFIILYIKNNKKEKDINYFINMFKNIIKYIPSLLLKKKYYKNYLILLNNKLLKNNDKKQNNLYYRTNS